MTNWQNETDKIITGLNGKKTKLLLHACCAPCSSASLEYLTEFFDITVFFYNPNISSAEEYEKRRAELERFINEAPFTKNVKLISENYDHNEFLEISNGLEQEKEGGPRCAECFGLRLAKTAQMAVGNYDFFATTLTISPLKNAQLINTIGLSLGEKFGVSYLPTDLKKKERYKRSIELSNEYKLYRQNFCGCEYSK